MNEQVCTCWADYIRALEAKLRDANITMPMVNIAPDTPFDIHAEQAQPAPPPTTPYPG